MNKIAVFAGSFSPFTKGHEDIVSKALPLFDQLVIAVGQNAQKKNAFTVEQRLSWIRGIYANNPKVMVLDYQGLTTDLCHRLGAQYLVRGVRNTMDFAAEQELAAINHELAPDVQTIFLPCSLEYSMLSSSMVRELWSLHADYSNYLSYKLPEIQ